MENKEEIKEFQNYLIQEAQANNKDPEKYVQELGEEGLKEAYKRFQTYKQKKTKKAAHGAKLDYIKRLKDQCAEDEELVYFKRGGSIGCGCVKKKETGGTVPKKPQSAVEKFKNRKQNPNWTPQDEQKLDSLSRQRTLTPQGEKDKSKLQKKFKQAPNSKNYELEEGKHGAKLKKNCGGTKFKLGKGTKIKVSC